MDMYDGFWFPEQPCAPPMLSGGHGGAMVTTTTTCLSSPSSGYSSADEGRATPVGAGGWPSAVVDSGWASPHCLLSSDPYLVGTPASAAGRFPMRRSMTPNLDAGHEADAATSASLWSGTTVLDDFMDTLWDSLGPGLDTTQRQYGTGTWTGETEMLVDNVAGGLTKQYPITTTTTTTTSYGYCDSANGYNAPFGVTAGAIGENSLVDLVSGVDHGLRTSASGAVFVGPPLSAAACRLNLQATPGSRRRVNGGLQQHMAGLMSDMATGDADDYVFQYGPVDHVAAEMKPAPLQSESPGAGRFLGGVLGQRTASNSMFHAAASSSSRVRGAVLAKSCGDSLLQRAAAGLSTASGPVHPSVANRSTTPASVTAKLRSAAAAGGGQQSAARVTGIRSSMSASHLSDVRGGGGASRVPSYPALDDHRYTLKVPPPSNAHPPPSKIPKTGTRSSGMRHSASSGRLVGVTSILEAFLRSTRPMDPNKGSNAALASAGLTHLGATGDRVAATQTTAADRGVDDGVSGTLLKKLLTGEMDQNDVQRSIPSGTDTSPPTESESMPCRSLATDDSIDALFVDGFGFDGDWCISDSQSINLSLLDDVDEDVLWMTTGDNDDFFDDKVDWH